MLSLLLALDSLSLMDIISFPSSEDDDGVGWFVWYLIFIIKVNDKYSITQAIYSSINYDFVRCLTILNFEQLDFYRNIDLILLIFKNKNHGNLDFLREL